MTPEHKKVWRVVGITAGVLLIASAIVIIVVIQKKKRDEQVDDTPTAAPRQSGSASSPKPASTGKYTKQEIENMQSMLYNYGVMGYNQVIIKAIQDTGGIDGVIGDGFYYALHEPIRVGYFKSIEELYYFANRK